MTSSLQRAIRRRRRLPGRWKPPASPSTRPSMPSDGAVRRQEAMVLAGAGGLTALIVLALGVGGSSKAAEEAPLSIASSRPGADERRASADALDVQPQKSRGVSPVLKTAAQLCTGFARVQDVNDVQRLLARASDAMDAAGLVVWLGNSEGADLQPVLTQGYSAETRARLPNVPRAANNAAAAAYRSGHVQIVRSRPGGSERGHRRTDTRGARLLRCAVRRDPRRRRSFGERADPRRHRRGTAGWGARPDRDGGVGTARGRGILLDFPPRLQSDVKPQSSRKRRVRVLTTSSAFSCGALPGVAHRGRTLFDRTERKLSLLIIPLVFVRLPWARDLKNSQCGRVESNGVRQLQAGAGTAVLRPFRNLRFGATNFVRQSS